MKKTDLLLAQANGPTEIIQPPGGRVPFTCAFTGRHVGDSSGAELDHPMLLVLGDPKQGGFWVIPTCASTCRKIPVTEQLSPFARPEKNHAMNRWFLCYAVVDPTRSGYFWRPSGKLIIGARIAWLPDAQIREYMGDPFGKWLYIEGFGHTIPALPRGETWLGQPTRCLLTDAG